MWSCGLAGNWAYNIKYSYIYMSIYSNISTTPRAHIPYCYSSPSSSIRLLSSTFPLFRPLGSPPTVSVAVRCSSTVVSVMGLMDGSLGSAVLPLHRCKTVHLVRHAQGTHNVEGEKDHKAYLSPEHFDAHLTQLGWEQVDNLRKHVQSSGLSKNLDLVIVSPLLRTIQTAVGVFGGEECTDGIDALPLMVANAGNSDRSAISSLNCPPFISVEKCREHLGVHPCDKRRNTREYELLFPAIDFSLIENKDDILWSADTRETNEHLASRGVEFINWLWTRKEKEIAIVTHSGFLYHTLQKISANYPPLIKDEISGHFANCELRSFTLMDNGALGSDSSSTNYPGGKIPK